MIHISDLSADTIEDLCNGDGAFEPDVITPDTAYYTAFVRDTCRARVLIPAGYAG